MDRFDEAVDDFLRVAVTDVFVDVDVTDGFGGAFPITEPFDARTSALLRCGGVTGVVDVMDACGDEVGPFCSYS